MKVPYSYIALFKTWRMAWRTICVTIAFTASAFVYYQLVINLSNLDGNIYLNMFLMGLVEGPGCMAAVWFSNKVSILTAGSRILQNIRIVQFFCGYL